MTQQAAVMYAVAAQAAAALAAAETPASSSLAARAIRRVERRRRRRAHRCRRRGRPLLRLPARQPAMTAQQQPAQLFAAPAASRSLNSSYVAPVPPCASRVARLRLSARCGGV